MTQRVNDGTTHWEGCWREHHACMERQIADMVANTVNAMDWLHEKERADALAAHVTRLREAWNNLREVRVGNAQLKNVVSLRGWFSLLAATPEQSLVAHDAEVIERCAEVADGYEKAAGGESQKVSKARNSRVIAAAIRALKPASEGGKP